MANPATLAQLGSGDRHFPAVPNLTRAEREVFEVLLTGAHNREIAETLSLSEATIRTHLTHIYAKCDVDGRAALLARMNGVSSVDSLGRGPRRVPATRRLPLITLVLVVLLAAALFAFTYLAFDLTSGDRPTQPRELESPGPVRMFHVPTWPMIDPPGPTTA